MKFGEYVGYGPKKNSLYFGSDPEHILDILNIVHLRVGRGDSKGYKISDNDDASTFILGDRL